MPVKEENINGVVDNSHIPSTNNKRFNQYASHEAKHSSTFIKSSGIHSHHPTSKSFKYKLIDQKISDFATTSPGRKKSVISYHKIEKTPVDEYAAIKSKHSSNENLTTSKTPLIQKGPPYNTSNSATFNKYEKNSNVVKAIKGRGQPTFKHPPGQTSMLIDFCSLYINREQISLNTKNKFTKYQAGRLPNLNNSKELSSKELGNKESNNKESNSKESHSKKLASSKNKFKITFNRQNKIANSYLNSTLRRRSNNLSKLHEFENNLLVKQNQVKGVVVRREKNISNTRDKPVRKMVNSLIH
jgi:hypothetical protein